MSQCLTIEHEAFSTLERIVNLKIAHRGDFFADI